MFYDPLYLIMLLPAMVLAGLASWYTQSTFKKYSRIGAASGITGAEAAHRLLASQSITNVRIERVDGFLSDHYDPISRTLRLSSKVYDSPSLAAVGVACHEAGHAISMRRIMRRFICARRWCRQPSSAAMHPTLFSSWAYYSISPR